MQSATMVGQALGARKPDRAERSVRIRRGYNAVFSAASDCRWMGPHAVFVSIPAEYATLATVSIVLFRRGTWKTKVV